MKQLIGWSDSTQQFHLHHFVNESTEKCKFKNLMASLTVLMLSFLRTEKIRNTVSAFHVLM